MLSVLIAADLSASPIILIMLGEAPLPLAWNNEATANCMAMLSIAVDDTDTDVLACNVTDEFIRCCDTADSSVDMFRAMLATRSAWADADIEPVAPIVTVLKNVLPAQLSANPVTAPIDTATSRIIEAESENPAVADSGQDAMALKMALIDMPPVIDNVSNPTLSSVTESENPAVAATLMALV
jgi:hypothetical protein